MSDKLTMDVDAQIDIGLRDGDCYRICMLHMNWEEDSRPMITIKDDPYSDDARERNATSIYVDDWEKVKGVIDMLVKQKKKEIKIGVKP